MQGLNVSIGNVFVVVSGGRYRSLGVLFLSLVQGPGVGAPLSSSMLVEELLPYFPPSPLLSDLPRPYLLSFSNAGIDKQKISGISNKMTRIESCKYLNLRRIKTQHRFNSPPTYL